MGLTVDSRRRMGQISFSCRGELKAEVKLRKKPPTATLERWLSAADVLFTCAGGRKTNNALVTMRLSTFLEHFALPVETEDNDDG